MKEDNDLILTEEWIIPVVFDINSNGIELKDFIEWDVLNENNM